MKVNFALLCDYANISREGKLSAMGIFSVLKVASFPAIHGLMYLVYEIELQPSEMGTPFRLGIKLVDADGQKSLEIQSSLKIEGMKAEKNEPARVPQVLAIGGMPVGRAGKYSMDIFLNDDLKISAAFDVVGRGNTPGEGAIRVGRKS